VTVPDRLRLPLDFDVAAMAADVAALPDSSWVDHFNTAIFEGRWCGVALRSVGGRPAQLYPDPTATDDFADTQILADCPNLRGAVAQLRCPLTAVRLLALDPGAVIKEHRDYRLGYDDGEVRLHIPILTSPEVEFVLAGEAVTLRAGECWYLDLNQPHRAANRSRQRRVHLVADCVVDEWLEKVLADATTSVLDVQSISVHDCEKR
jgi:quercetin dioxygenase-like cupin family protein